MQREFALLGSAKSPERIPANLIALCRTSGEAVRLAVNYGKRSIRQVADLIGMEAAQLSRIVTGNAQAANGFALACRIAAIAGQADQFFRIAGNSIGLHQAGSGVGVVAQTVDLLGSAHGAQQLHGFLKLFL